jgi:hypothetical protein
MHMLLLQSKRSAGPALPCLGLSYPILSYPILSYPILSYPIPSHPVLSRPVPPCPILSPLIIGLSILAYRIVTLPRKMYNLYRFSVPESYASPIWICSEP